MDRRRQARDALAGLVAERVRTSLGLSSEQCTGTRYEVVFPAPCVAPVARRAALPAFGWGSLQRRIATGMLLNFQMLPSASAPVVLAHERGARLIAAGLEPAPNRDKAVGLACDEMLGVSTASRYR